MEAKVLSEAKVYVGTAPGDRRAGIQRETGAAYHADRSRHLSGIRIER